MGFDPFIWLADLAEDLWNEVVNSGKMLAARGGALNMAEAYHLDGDDEAFRILWALTTKATLAELGLHADAQAEVGRALGLLRTLADTAPATATGFGKPITVVVDDGFLTTQVAATAGRYVVFSDHHMLYHGARQNFFKHGYQAQNQSGEADSNYDLYLEILGKYYGVADYTLVENGDIEELLIYEPVLAEIKDAASWTWGEILAYRNSKKLSQLARIARDNRSYYQTIQTHFTDRKKYFRITGNHDRDMRSQAFVDVVRDATATALPLASDVLLLRGAGDVDYIICHGHQFDSSCTPKHAAKLGETLTQGGAWAYQGPDRVWRESKDPIADWRRGGRPVQNELVTDQPTDYQTTLEALIGAVDPVTGELIGDAAQFLVDALGVALGSLDSERGWETIYGKNIAWEYFDNANSPELAIRDEVKTGKRWFKFRHMNEFRIVAELDSLFAGRPTRLILGHSHEPRFRPGKSLPGQPHRTVDSYLNCASAGRFQNLIWGIELIDGEPFLVSWHREDRPPVGNVAVRTLWENALDGATSVLRPIASATIAELLGGATGLHGDTTTLRIAADHII
ncbi:hypothetical protein LHP98_00575 [Rhodobacter sp. Har01]|uniref:hypothetical protein n=1 Tax=Rhodobacter sp. Har01 TaxID=2883999 RepID=UPI001D066697|nr:hypothetical protein [Rhodobacter sp. Har01]MCB6176624.1 hypothetical protein [Rhodobacter sp. Har01]